MFCPIQSMDKGTAMDKKAAGFASSMGMPESCPLHRIQQSCAHKLQLSSPAQLDLSDYELLSAQAWLELQ